MTNPIAIFDNLRQTYLRYLDSPFDLRYQPLVEERRAMLDRDGRLYRTPLIEPIPPYVSSARLFPAAAAEILNGAWPAPLIGDLAAFVGQGLFPAHRELHQHQYEAILAAVRNRQDIVVTSGTGSGKTECFLLPIAAALIEESSRWGACPLFPLRTTGGTTLPRLGLQAEIIRASRRGGTTTPWSGQLRCARW